MWIASEFHQIQNYCLRTCFAVMFVFAIIEHLISSHTMSDQWLIYESQFTKSRCGVHSFGCNVRSPTIVSASVPLPPTPTSLHVYSMEAKYERSIIISCPHSANKCHEVISASASSVLLETHEPFFRLASKTAGSGQQDPALRLVMH